MNPRAKGLLSLLRSNFTPYQTTWQNQCNQFGTLVRVRLKWVKNRFIDHIIETQTDLKAACLLKDAIQRTSTGYVTSKSIAEWQKLLGLTVPTMRFMRRYPTLFEEFPHPKYPSLPCFRLTEFAKFLHNKEREIHKTHEGETIERLSRLLMMAKNQTIPLQSLHALKWDMGFPDDFDSNLVKRYPDLFQVVKGSSNGLTNLKLLEWNKDFAVSELQKGKEKDERSLEYRKLRRGESALGFAMNFPRGYGAQKKVKAWMDEFQKLPYISPYEDSSGIDPNSDLMEKRVVGVLHEFLSLTIYKKTKRNYLRGLREELNLPHRFTRIFTRYPGIFYLSLKCKTTTVAIREGYKRGKLVNPTPISRLRDKFFFAMRTGLIYRSKGVDMLPKIENFDLDNDPPNEIKDDEDEEESDEDEIRTGEDCYEDGSCSDLEADSDKD